MDAIIALAERLGKAISESPQAAGLRDARDALSTEPELSRLLEDHRKQSEKIGQLERDQKPIEVDDKHKLEELQDKLFASETFKKFTAAQVEYVDLMRRVNESLREQLAQIESEAAQPSPEG